MRFYWALFHVALMVAPISASMAGEPCAAPPCFGAPTELAQIRDGALTPNSHLAEAISSDGQTLDELQPFPEARSHPSEFVNHEYLAQIFAALSLEGITFDTLFARIEERDGYGNPAQPVEQTSAGVFFINEVDLPASKPDPDGAQTVVLSGSSAVPVMADLSDMPQSSLKNAGSALVSPWASGEGAIVEPSDAKGMQFNYSGLRGPTEFVSVQRQPLESVVVATKGRPDWHGFPETETSESQFHSVISTASSKLPSQPEMGTDKSESRILYGTVTVLLLLSAGLTLYSYRLYLKLKFNGQRLQQVRDMMDIYGVSFLVADSSMIIRWWNDALEVSYPEIKDALREGRSIKDYLYRVFKKDADYVGMSDDEARSIAESTVWKLQSQSGGVSVEIPVSGRAIRQNFARLPSGGFAAVCLDCAGSSKELDHFQQTISCLEEANARLERFGHLLAHDLLSPIRNQLHLLDFIKEDLEDLGVNLTPEIAEHFQQADEMLERQGKLVTDLLEWSHAKHVSQAVPFDAKKSIENAVALAGLPEDFRVIVENELPTLNACPVAFELVVRNLVSNAVKHHDRDTGEIRIAGHMGQRDVIIFVSDDGPGIPTEFQERMFHPFETLSGKQDSTGSGLGLAFVREAVEGWGGTVQALESPGKRGACFRFTIPLHLFQPVERPNLRLVAGGAA